MEHITWNGFDGDKFDFMGLPAYVIRPSGKPNGKWIYKTEYFGAFPNGEIELLRRGWHLAYNQNINRWAEDEDLDRKSAFIRYVSKTYGLSPRCVPVGMSCGGLIAVKLAARYPEQIACLYLDAPVMNLLSCPGALGRGTYHVMEEYTACTGRTLVDLLSYRGHPIDVMHVLLENRLPIVLVAGDSDVTVPYEENGALLEKYYRENGGTLRVFLKPGCDHHPHGLEDPAVLADTIEELAGN